jgi:hypothetical protein
MRLVFIDLESERPDLGAPPCIPCIPCIPFGRRALMASIRVVLATKTSALNAVYFIFAFVFALIHWFAEIASPLRAGTDTRSSPVLRQPG